MANDKFRPLTSEERRILEKLLSLDFVGRKELMQQLPGLLVRDKKVDNEGSIEFEVNSNVRAPVGGMVAEGRCPDINTSEANPAYINLLLHVRDGRLWLLEFYKDDSSQILQRPDPEKLDLFSPKPKNE